MGLILAQKANADWLNDGFSSRQHAKIKFGQPLSPGDTNSAKIRQRKILIEKLNTYFTGVADENVICILGSEGNGKSWIIAQSWQSLAHKPIMLFMSADDFSEKAGQNDIVCLLVSKLITQTGDGISEIIQKRWHRRLRQWRDRTAIDSPQIVVVVDGINQRPNSDWARIIDSLSDELNHLGGRLIVTSRTTYFKDRVSRRISVPFTEIHIPEWTENERDEILNELGIKASDLHYSVSASLRNPRLLGIALELLDKADITNFEEISVSRLFFEHIRIGERDAPVPQPAMEFVCKLQKHAQEIINRVKANQQDDLNIFDADMGAVADGRFYHAVDGDPMKYSLKDDGLTLALGFAVIDRMLVARRNNRNLEAELEAILEPISALDDTTDVIIAALTVATVGSDYEQDITTSLVKGFATLQNPDESKFLTFSGLAKKRPQAFMDAAHKLCVAGGHQLNYDWIRDALIAAGRNNSTWLEMADKVHFWLSAYSLSPERGINGKAPEEFEKNSKEIANKLRSLSVNERLVLEEMPQEEGNLSNLSHLGMLLLAGKPLVPFARSLLNWSFSYALNSDSSAPYKDFIHLVSLNRMDWGQSRAALLEVSKKLRDADVSTTGKWSLVTILRSTGHSDDGKEAESLVKELTKDWPKFEGWNLIEEYCAIDPCDPASEQPKNVMRTAEQYAAINVSKLRKSRNPSSEDHFFVMARPGISRFKPEVAFTKHREFAEDVLNRSGIPLIQGLFELRQHNALLTINDAWELVKQWNGAKTAATTIDLSERENWIISQYRLLLAFPFLSAQDQTKILLSIKPDEKILRDLLYLAKPIHEKEFETFLGLAYNENNESKQYLLLALSRYTSVPLSADTRTLIASLFRSELRRVRTEALGVIAQSGDKGLLNQVAESDWEANDDEMENDFEAWYGSAAILEAAANGLIEHPKALDRISARMYGRAAKMLDVDAVHEIACRINDSINHIVGINDELIAPDIESQVYPSIPHEPRTFNMSDRTMKAKDLKEAMRQLSESSEAFEQRQNRAYNSFLEFRAKLTQAKARIILDHLSPDEFENIVATDEGLADRWYKLFMRIEKPKLPAVYNFILLLARALAERAPDKAKELYLRIKNSKPLVRFRYGEAGVQLDEMATWSGLRSPIINELRFARLDRASTDYDLSIEALAAQICSQQVLLTSYIKSKLSKVEPAEISRGIMVAGFSDKSDFNDEIFMRYEGSAGLIGSAYKAAKYAYERNVWARHWFEKMCQTDENTTFWCYAVLFLKIVDGRFDVWRTDYFEEGSAIRLFGSPLKNILRNRFKRWEYHRNKKLFGSDVPETIFLQRADIKE